MTSYMNTSLIDPRQLTKHEESDVERQSVHDERLAECQSRISVSKSQSTSPKRAGNGYQDSVSQAQRITCEHRRTLHMTGMKVTGYDAFEQTVLLEHSPCNPKAWKMFELYFPQESSKVMDVAKFDASVAKCLRVSEHATLLSRQKYDDDICIRAAILGWDSIESDHFDLVWDVLREMDQAIVHNCGEVERIAMLRILRAVLAGLAYPLSEKRSTFPEYMAPSALQQAATPSTLVDILIWPSLRDLLTAAKYKFLPADFLIRYFQTLQFSWPYDIRDVYRVNTETKEHIFADEFDRRYRDLRCWSLRSAEGQESLQISMSTFRAHEEENKPEEQCSLETKVGNSCNSGQFDDEVVSVPVEPGWFAPYETEIRTAMNADPNFATLR